jgi:hypothetical protein
MSSILSIALIAIGIKNCLAKYSPLIIKNIKMIRDILLTSDGAE